MLTIDYSYYHVISPSQSYRIQQGFTVPQLRHPWDAHQTRRSSPIYSDNIIIMYQLYLNPLSCCWLKFPPIINSFPMKSHAQSPFLLCVNPMKKSAPTRDPKCLHGRGKQTSTALQHRQGRIRGEQCDLAVFLDRKIRSLPTQKWGE